MYAECRCLAGLLEQRAYIEEALEVCRNLNLKVTEHLKLNNQYLHNYTVSCSENRLLPKKRSCILTTLSSRQKPLPRYVKTQQQDSVSDQLRLSRPSCYTPRVTLGEAHLWQPSWRHDSNDSLQAASLNISYSSYPSILHISHNNKTCLEDRVGRVLGDRQVEVTGPWEVQYLRWVPVATRAIIPRLTSYWPHTPHVWRGHPPGRTCGGLLWWVSCLLGTPSMIIPQRNVQLCQHWNIPVHQQRIIAIYKTKRKLKQTLLKNIQILNTRSTITFFFCEWLA